jgi:hypothetical protein
LTESSSGIYATLSGLVDRLDSGLVGDADVIRWASPVPSFGDLLASQVATLGLNPSNREFVDETGRELDGPARRFHTLNSLGLTSWADADLRHLRLIMASCRDYFRGNPYDRWFRTLDQVLIPANVSYYSSNEYSACHLDLIPYATAQKWTGLTPSQRKRLLTGAGDTLALLVRDSPVKVIVLNGRSVVEHFTAAFGATLEAREMTGWSLPRGSGKNVPGVAYRGLVAKLAGIDLEREVLVVGFNHNLQSSFGVTTAVIQRVGQWVADELAAVGLDETT